MWDLESEIMLPQSVQGTVATPFANLANEFSNDIMEIQLQTVIRQMEGVVGLLDGNVASSEHI